MPDVEKNAAKATSVAARLATLLDEAGVDYAFGGAIALAFAGEPRATIDVDMTLFVDPPEPAACVDALDRIGCKLHRNSALDSLAEHGFCRVQFEGLQVDVFLPTIPFHQAARKRRLRVKLLDQDCYVYGPEAVTVLKMMFFREKDLVDVKQILRVQGSGLDRDWIREQLVQIFGVRDPRIAAWDECTAGIPPE
jgi:hypothetical protein